METIDLLIWRCRAFKFRFNSPFPSFCCCICSWLWSSCSSYCTFSSYAGVYFSFKSWLSRLCSMLWLSAMVTEKEEYKKECELAFRPWTVPINYKGFIFRPFFFFCAFCTWVRKLLVCFDWRKLAQFAYRHFYLTWCDTTPWIFQLKTKLFCFSIADTSPYQVQFNIMLIFTLPLLKAKLWNITKARKQILWSVINVGSKKAIGKSNFVGWCNDHRSILMSAHRQDAKCEHSWIWIQPWSHSTAAYCVNQSRLKQLLWYLLLWVLSLDYKCSILKKLSFELSKKKKIAPEKQDAIAVANLYDMTSLLHCTNERSKPKLFVKKKNEFPCTWMPISTVL